MIVPDAIRDQGVQLRELGCWIASGVADLHGHPTAVGRVDHSTCDLGEVRVDDLVDEQSDDRARSTGKGSGVLVDDVAEPSRSPRTFSATCWLTPGECVSERDAVAIETPAASATSMRRTDLPLGF